MSRWLHSSIKMASKIQAENGPVTTSGRFCVPLFADIGFYSLVIYLLDNMYIWPKTNTLCSLWAVSGSLFPGTTVSPSKINYFMFRVIFIFFPPLIVDYLRKIKYVTHKKKNNLHTFLFFS